MTLALSRRSLLTAAGRGLGCGWLATSCPAAARLHAAVARDAELRLATFRFDATPPPGHSLCGGWITPVRAIADPLEGLGLVLLGAGPPVVICSLDWTGVLNRAHLEFREALAAAAETTPERVAVHCVHQHDAPFACLDAQDLVAPHADLPAIVDVEFFAEVLRRAGAAVREAVPRARPIDGVASSMARVRRVAANRRILSWRGVVESQRGSSSRDSVHHVLPEGLIDPYLRTVAFYQGRDKLAACHYYACHPMSHYGQGQVSADFCGLARRARQAEEPNCLHVYFNGCGGNIGAGKYNDGSPAMRPVLRDRILEGLRQSEAKPRIEPIGDAAWATCNVLPQPNPALDAERIAAEIRNRDLRVVQRNRPAYALGYIRRHQRRQPIVLSALHVNATTLLHLPAECFVEYQLRAQSEGAAAGRTFVATAAYGDGGPWYIPLREAFAEGGYAVSVAFCDDSTDALLTNGVQQLLSRT